MAEYNKTEAESYLPARREILPVVSSKSANELSDCVQMLDVLPMSTENEFLFIGSRLRDFYERSKSISAVAGSVALRMSDENMTITIGALSDLVETMAASQKKSESDINMGIEILRRIAAIIDDIHEQMEELSELTRSLRALGFSTMIQNASLTRPDSGIQQLGEDVQKLSATVADKSSSLGNGIRNLNALIRGSIRTLNKLEAEQRISAAAVIKSMTAGIEGLQEKYRQSSCVADEISVSSVDISRDIGEIVTSLQFHDITRQMFENAKQEFDEMLLSFAAGASCYEGRDAGPETDRRQFIEKVTEFCRYESDILLEGRDMFVGAVKRVIGNLGGAAAEVRKTVAGTEKIIKADRSARGSFLSEIEAVLSSVIANVLALSESTLVKKELAETVKQVAVIAEEMSGFVLGIEEIGDEVELIAFNAAIKAEHIGGEGKPLGVVAEFVQRISAKAPIYTTAISEMIKSVASSADELSHDIFSAEQKSEEQIGGMSETLKKMVGSLRDLNREIVSSCAEIETAGHALSEDIEGVVAHIQVHHQVAHALDSALEILTRISRSMRSAMPGIARSEKPTDQVRLLHETRPGRYETVRPVYTDPGKFADNVELF